MHLGRACIPQLQDSVLLHGEGLLQAWATDHEQRYGTNQSLGDTNAMCC